MIQGVNPHPDYDVNPASFRNSLEKIKRDIRAGGEYGRWKKEFLHYAAISPTVDEFEKKVLARDELNAKSVTIPRDGVASCSYGPLFSLKLKLWDGTVFSISTMLLRKIRKFLSGREIM